MAKFNETKVQRKGQKTTNYMGEVALTQSLKEELVFLSLTTFVEDAYYEKAGDQLKRLRTLVQDLCKHNPTFVAKLAVYARTKAHMRSIFHVLVGELARNHNGDNLVYKTLDKGVVRVDDMSEIISYIKTFSKKIPNQVKKGLSHCFDRFDAYQLAKYRSENKNVKLVDVVNLVHPKPTQRNNEALSQLIAGTLRNTKTLESKLSQTGGKDKTVEEVAQAKEEAWEDLLGNRKMNVMAVLRNLRNILQTGNAELVDLACNVLRTDKLILNSRQLPFRFLSAYEEVEKLSKSSDSTIKFEKSGSSLVNQVLEAIEYACVVSTKNLPNLSGTTAILTDNSGSMRGDSGGGSAVSANSKRTSADIANLFSLLYWYRSDNTYIGLFGDKLLTFVPDRSKGVLANFKALDNVACTVGAGTEQGIFRFFETCLKDNVYPDRIIVFSDCQIGSGNRWYGRDDEYLSGSFGQLLKKFQEKSPHTQIFCVNLRGYGNTVFNNNVIEIAGWSDNIFKILENNDRAALVQEIEKVEL